MGKSTSVSTPAHPGDHIDRIFDPININISDQDITFTAIGKPDSRL